MSGQVTDNSSQKPVHVSMQAAQRVLLASVSKKAVASDGMIAAIAQLN